MSIKQPVLSSRRRPGFGSISPVPKQGGAFLKRRVRPYAAHLTQPMRQCRLGGNNQTRGLFMNRFALGTAGAVACALRHADGAAGGAITGEPLRSESIV